FLFLRRATEALWPSAFVAALFAWHPLHVESVAWLSERKDVLCALFWMLTLWAYARYATVPSPRNYMTALGFFVLGLMSKPMIVTLPFVLLTLDYWPLQRKPETGWRQLMLEKIPFLLLAGLMSAVAVWSQRGATS